MLQDTFSNLEISKISVVDNFNHRIFIDDDENDFNDIEALASDIKENGVLQPIVVRPKDNENDLYEIVAGERRWRASQVADLDVIPCVIKHIDKNTAYQLSVSENLQRQDVTPVEESTVAYKLISINDGSKEEVMRYLGWSLKKLNSRLMLNNCIQSVKESIVKKEISIGIAELMSGLTKENQQVAITNIIKHDLDVLAVKAMIEKMSFQLKDAVFCQKQCNSCKHNSSQQMSLFDVLEDGQCLNPPCYEEKTKEKTDHKLAELKDDYNCIFTTAEKHPDDYTETNQILLTEQQQSDCKTCKSNGAIVNEKLEVTAGICFKVDCYNDCLKCNEQSIKAEEIEAIEEETDVVETAGNDKKETVKKPAPKPKTVSVTTGVVQEHVDNFHSTLAKRTVHQSTVLTHAMTIFSLSNQVSGTDRGLIEKKYNIKIGTTVRDVIKNVRVFEQDKIDTLLKLLPAMIISNNHLSDCRSILKEEKVDLVSQFDVNKNYLKRLTKTGIEQLLNESKFTEYFKQNNPDRKKSLMSEKKDDLIEIILKEKFDFSNYIPASHSLGESK